MEIITYILEGELKHEDSMGNGSIIRPGDVQRMTAGTGVGTVNKTRRLMARASIADLDNSQRRKSATRL